MAAGKPKLWTEAEDKRLLRMYRDGYMREAIAESLGRTKEAVSKRKKHLEETCSTS